MRRSVNASLRMVPTIKHFIKYDGSEKSDIVEILLSIYGFHHKINLKVLEDTYEILVEMEQLYVQVCSIISTGKKFKGSNMRSNNWFKYNIGYQKFGQLAFHVDCLRQEMSFFQEVALEIMLLCENLRFLLTFLEVHSGKSSSVPLVLNCVKDIANRTADYVENCMVDMLLESKVKRFVYSISNPILGDDDDIDIELLHFFHGKKGIRQFLLGTLDEMQSLKGQIREIICDEKHGPRDSHVGITSPRASSSGEGNSNLENVVVGLDADLIRMVDRLTKGTNRLETVTIVGMGGIGKTTLAKKTYHDLAIVYHFHCRAWVTVSQAHHQRNMLSSLLNCVDHNTNEIHKKSFEDLVEILHKSLKRRRYLIVFDDMWSVHAWDAVRGWFPDDENGSRIIMTSRSMELSIYANPTIPPHQMSLLDAEQSWELLQKLVFGEQSCHPSLIEVGKQISKECVGLPLAIAVIAGILTRINRAHDCWMDVAQTVSSLVCTNQEQCLDILALSYNYLPYHLKGCFLYMGAFPEDSEIEVYKLINLWVAEGFFDLNSSNDVEEEAEDFLEDLVGRNLVLVGKRNSRGKIKTCQLHDFVRELCLREFQKINFMHVIEREDQHFPVSKDECSRLILHLNSDCDVHLTPSYPHLQSFLCFSLGSNFVPDIFFSCLHFRPLRLRVLDMFFLHFDSFLIEILELVNLRYLALNVTYDLPSEISELWKLQTLVIHGPWIPWKDEESPTLLLEYWRLPYLRHLYVTVASHLCCASTAEKAVSMAVAPNLQTLSRITFAACKEEVFTVMVHLRKLEICETKEDYRADGSSKCLENLKYLKDLEIVKCFFCKKIRQRRILYCRLCQIVSGN